jgi:catechol 2,3-dioxygenase-like lactoylglutathione lyase family enzyme
MKFNPLIPELYCSNFERSLEFYTNLVGFSVSYSRPEEKFAFLEREGAQLMIEELMQSDRTWLAGRLEHPYGRGVNLQIRTMVCIRSSRCIGKQSRVCSPEQNVFKRRRRS